MARQLDATQKAELVAFLNELYKLGGYTTQKQWADEAGYHQTNLSTAMNGTVLDGVDGYTLLKLMRTAASRAEAPVEDVVRRTADSRAEETLRRLRELEAKVAELPTADDLGRAAATLQAAIDRLATAGSRVVQQAKPARRRDSR